jgi:hypothetical protein
MHQQSWDSEPIGEDCLHGASTHVLTAAECGERDDEMLPLIIGICILEGLNSTGESMAS